MEATAGPTGEAVGLAGVQADWEDWAAEAAAAPVTVAAEAEAAAADWAVAAGARAKEAEARVVGAVKVAGGWEPARTWSSAAAKAAATFPSYSRCQTSTWRWCCLQQRPR